MAKDKDVFGFDELTKSFKKMEQKYPNEADLPSQRWLYDYSKVGK